MAKNITNAEAIYNRDIGFPYECYIGRVNELPTNEDCEIFGEETHVTSHGGVFICEHCNKLVFIDNIAENVGNTVKCECGHMYLINEATYFEKVKSVVDLCGYGDPRMWDFDIGFWKITKPVLKETTEPYRRVITANCVPIVLKSGKHYHGEDLDAIDIGFTLSLMTEEQKNIVFESPYNELNSSKLVYKMNDYRDEEIRKEQERAAAEKKQKEAEFAAYKADKIRRRLMPWQKFWTAIAKVCNFCANLGQPE